MAVQLGKRYKDEETGVELLVIKPGKYELKVNGKDYGPHAAKGPPVRRLAFLPNRLTTEMSPARGPSFCACASRGRV